MLEVDDLTFNMGIAGPKKLIEVSLRWLKQDNKVSGNSLFVWEAILTCHELEMALPEWVLEYLYKSAKRLLKKKGEDSFEQIASALGLYTGGGPNALTMYRDNKVRYFIVREISKRTQHPERYSKRYRNSYEIFSEVADLAEQKFDEVPGLDLENIKNKMWSKLRRYITL